MYVWSSTPALRSSPISRSSHWRSWPFRRAPMPWPASRPPPFTLSLTARRDRLTQLCKQNKVIADDAVDARGREPSRLFWIVHRPTEDIHPLLRENPRALLVQKAVLDAAPPHAFVVAHQAHELLPLEHSLHRIADP